MFSLLDIYAFFLSSRAVRLQIKRKTPIGMDALSPWSCVCVAIHQIFLESAENRVASSLWVGGHRYTRIFLSCQNSYGYSDFKSEVVNHKVAWNRLKIG